MKIEQSNNSKKTFLNSEELLEGYSKAYFKSIDEANKVADKRKPYSETGLVKYLGISYTTWMKTRDNLKMKTDTKNVIQGIETIIRANQIEGALMNVFPACILNETFWKKHEERELRFKQ